MSSPEIGYVGSKGQHLIRQPDINQASFEALAANAALPSSQRLSTNYLRPYKGSTAIRKRHSDAESEYNALQVYLSKRKGDLRFTLNYTLSKAMDNASSNTANTAAGEDYLNPDYNWGAADHDRRHIFVATWNYRLPFFKNDKGALGNILGGWEVSGIARYQSGAPLTAVGTTTGISTRRADLIAGADPYTPKADRVNATTGVDQWLNPASFAVAPGGLVRVTSSAWIVTILISSSLSFNSLFSRFHISHFKTINNKMNPVRNTKLVIDPIAM